MKQLLRHNRALFGLIHQFNVYPASYMDASWVENLMPAELFERLRASKRGMQRLSQMILNQYQLASDYCYTFDTLSHRLALVPPKIIQKLVLYCGVALQYATIRSQVEKSAIEKIKKSVGEDAYQFVLRRVSLLSGSVAGCNMKWDGQIDFLTFTKNIGTSFYLSQLSHSPPAVLNRLVLKFPKDMTSTFSNHMDLKPDWQFIKRILIHEIDPTWHRLFS